MRTIGITGSQGFLGWHLSCLFGVQGDVILKRAHRTEFASEQSLQAFVEGCDAIIHCAGMNRGENAVVEATNIQLTAAPVRAAIHRKQSAGPVRQFHSRRPANGFWRIQTSLFSHAFPVGTTIGGHLYRHYSAWHLRRMRKALLQFCCFHLLPPDCGGGNSPVASGCGGRAAPRSIRGTADGTGHRSENTRAVAVGRTPHQDVRPARANSIFRQVISGTHHSGRSRRLRAGAVQHVSIVPVSALLPGEPYAQGRCTRIAFRNRKECQRGTNVCLHHGSGCNPRQPLSFSKDRTVLRGAGRSQDPHPPAVQRPGA